MSARHRGESPRQTPDEDPRRGPLMPLFKPLLSEIGWICIPAIDCVEYTAAAIQDAVVQTGIDARVLLVNNGSTTAARTDFERLADHMLPPRPDQTPRLLVWSWDPPLLSLSACWNRMLMFCWASGADRAMLVNNDVRLRPDTWITLDQV